MLVIAVVAFCCFNDECFKYFQSVFLTFELWYKCDHIRSNKCQFEVTCLTERLLNWSASIQPLHIGITQALSWNYQNNNLHHNVCHNDKYIKRLGTNAINIFHNLQQYYYLFFKVLNEKFSLDELSQNDLVLIYNSFNLSIKYYTKSCAF